MTDSKAKLIRLLQDAHAGERAAAFAYRGHSQSVKGQEALEIAKIEKEEWAHREELANMLQQLGAGPRPGRELLMILVGLTILVLCRLGGWLNVFNFGWYFSMYGAGKLERGNIVEYEIAARYAAEAGYPQFIECLLAMAEVEWDHELYFRSKCLESKWIKYLPPWSPPPPRETIQSGFEPSTKSKSPAASFDV